MSVVGYVKRFPRQGTAANVIAMRSAEWSVFEKGLEQRVKARLEATFETYCAYGPEDLPPTLFKCLGQKKAEGVQIRLEEFKASAVRLFGLRGDDLGQPTFFITGSDTAKKSNESRKANRISMDSAVKEAVKVQGELNGQKVASRGKRND